jgi:hypothetical protein
MVRGGGDHATLRGRDLDNSRAPPRARCNQTSLYGEIVYPDEPRLDSSNGTAPGVAAVAAAATFASGSAACEASAALLVRSRFSYLKDTAWRSPHSGVCVSRQSTTLQRKSVQQQ